MKILASLELDIDAVFHKMGVTFLFVMLINWLRSEDYQKDSIAV